MNAWSTVRLTRPTKDRLDAIAEKQIALPMRGRRTFAPCIKAARGDAEYAAEHGDGINGLVRSHESEDLIGIAFVSRANQAAADMVLMPVLPGPDSKNWVSDR